MHNRKLESARTHPQFMVAIQSIRDAINATHFSPHNTSYRQQSRTMVSSIVVCQQNTMWHPAIPYKQILYTITTNTHIDNGELFARIRVDLWRQMDFRITSISQQTTTYQPGQYRAPSTKSLSTHAHALANKHGSFNQRKILIDERFFSQNCVESCVCRFMYIVYLCRTSLKYTV